jgi:HD superfamily phosphohydrolase
MADHEDLSDALVRDSEVTEKLRALGSGFADDVADIISERGSRSIYTAVVSSQFDADRLDYMRRDRLMSGTQHAAIDFEWLMANLEVASVAYGVDETPLGEVQTFVLGPKAIFAAESFVLGLFQLYPTVYFHKATRGAEKIFTELLARAVTLVSDESTNNTGLPPAHPLVKFAKTPEDVECALRLDDTVIWGALSLMTESRDQLVSAFARRLRDRNLYKCIDVRTRIAREKDDAAAVSAEADHACATIATKLNEWSASHPSEVPRVLVDQESRSPYKKITETKGPLDQINIRTDGGHLEDLAKRSKVVAELETYKLFRVYHDDSDADAKNAIEAIIAEGIKEW